MENSQVKYKVRVLDGTIIKLPIVKPFYAKVVKNVTYTPHNMDPDTFKLTVSKSKEVVKFNISGFYDDEER